MTPVEGGGESRALVNPVGIFDWVCDVCLTAPTPYCVMQYMFYT